MKKTFRIIVSSVICAVMVSGTAIICGAASEYCETPVYKKAVCSASDKTKACSSSNCFLNIASKSVCTNKCRKNSDCAELLSCSDSCTNNLIKSAGNSLDSSDDSNKSGCVNLCTVTVKRSDKKCLKSEETTAPTAKDSEETETTAPTAKDSEETETTAPTAEIPAEKDKTTETTEPTEDTSETTNPKQTDNDKSNREYALEVIRLVNAERAEYGLTALQYNESAAEAAETRAEEISRVFSHTRPDGSSCFTLASSLDVTYKSLGENIAYGYKTPQAVVESWMNSSGHRANILSENYDIIGVGCYIHDGTIYWSQFFVGTTQ